MRETWAQQVTGRAPRQRAGGPSSQAPPRLHTGHIPRGLGVAGAIPSEVSIKGSRHLKITKPTAFPPSTDAGQGMEPSVLARRPHSRSSVPGRASCHLSRSCSPPPQMVAQPGFTVTAVCCGLGTVGWARRVGTRGANLTQPLRAHGEVDCPRVPQKVGRRKHGALEAVSKRASYKRGQCG